MSDDREPSMSNFSKSPRKGLPLVARAATLALALIFAAASGGHASERVALLLAVPDYFALGKSAVRVNGGLEIADLLRVRGFEVVSNVNPTNATARATLGDFLEKVKGSEAAIILLMGHGVSTSGQTFFLPKNATIERSTDLLSQGLSISNLIRIASKAKVAGVCFLMTAPNLPVGLDEVDLRPRIDGDIPANVSVAFSTSNRIPISQTDVMANQATNAMIALLKDNPHASLRQLSKACTSDAQGLEMGGPSDLDLATPPVAVAAPPAAISHPTSLGSVDQNDVVKGTPEPTLTKEAAVSIAPLQTSPEPLPFDLAVNNATATLLSQAPAFKPGDPLREIVIEPLVDARSGERNSATTKIGAMISDLMKESYKGFTVGSFNRSELAKRPLTLIGALETVNSLNIAEGPADAFWICLALVDLQTGKIVSKANARAWAAGVDTTPDIFFKESPIRFPDEATTADVKSCQVSKVGDSLGSDYATQFEVASVLSDAIEAYDAKRYSDAADLWRAALGSPDGQQLRAYNGLYLANWRLGREQEAKRAFTDLVDHGLLTLNGVVMFLFDPNSTVLDRSRGANPPYEMWLKAIATRAAANNACFQLVGHASRTGATDINDRLAARRAEYVRDRLLGLEPSLSNRTTATGVGSKETMVRSDVDGPDNAVDRRVELKLAKCEQKP